MSEREDDIVATFVSISGGLTRGRDVGELLMQLTADCSRLMDVSGVGVLLAGRNGSLEAMGASSRPIAGLQAFQTERGQGPCHTAYLEGRPVHVPDLEAESARWPDFAAAAAKADVASVHSVPMRLHDSVVGTLDLFGRDPGDLDGMDLRLAQGLADVATVALIRDRAITEPTTVVEQLQMALDSRVVLEQAKGVLSCRGDLDKPEAFDALRFYARDHGLRLTELAGDVVHRTMPTAAILRYARNRGIGVGGGTAPRTGKRRRKMGQRATEASP